VSVRREDLEDLLAVMIFTAVALTVFVLTTLK
jgi:hypothetical protein